MELTHRQFNLLATKEDLKKLDDKMDGRMEKMDGRMDKMDGRMEKMDKKTDKMLVAILENKDNLIELKDEMDNKMDRILTAVDDIANQLKTSKEERTSNQGAHDRMQKGIDKHEIRIKKLELRHA